MDSPLYRLFRLHKVDAALHELKAQAAALDVGQEEHARLKAAMAETEPVRSLAKQLKQEQTDLEFLAADCRSKRTNYEAKLYGGTVVSPKEIKALEDEITLLGRKANEADDRLLELMELLPKAEADAKEAERALGRLKAALEAKKKAAVDIHAHLKVDYSKRAKERDPAASLVPRPILDHYEAVRTRIGTPAMALVTDAQRCAACGMTVPEKVLDQVRQDKMVQCESCRRILFSQQGAV